MHQLYHEYVLNVPYILGNPVLEFGLLFFVSVPDKEGFNNPSPDRGIRTHDPIVPSDVRYQAALYPEKEAQICPWARRVSSNSCIHHIN